MYKLYEVEYISSDRIETTDLVVANDKDQAYELFIKPRQSSKHTTCYIREISALDKPEMIGNVSKGIIK